MLTFINATNMFLHQSLIPFSKASKTIFSYIYTVYEWVDYLTKMLAICFTDSHRREPDITMPHSLYGNYVFFGIKTLIQGLADRT